MTTAKQIKDQINKALGKDAIQFASDPRYQVTHIPTGVLPIDVLLDGGIPRGRITEFYGGFSSLKSYIAYCAIAQCQSEGGTAMLIDTEHAYEQAWGESIGINQDELIIDRPITGEEAIDKMQVAITGGVDLIVWDSVAATQPRDESTVQLSGDKKIQPARLAALMSTGLRRLNTTNKQTAIIAINQTRSKVGVVFGSPETTPGGNALPFYASLRVAFRKAGRTTEARDQWDGDKMAKVHDTLLQKIRVELIKTKLSRPEREQWFQWDTVNSQVDIIGYLIAIGLESGYIKRPKSGSTWVVGQKKCRGPKGVRQYLEETPKVRLKLKDQAVSLGSGVPLKSEAST